MFSVRRVQAVSSLWLLCTAASANVAFAYDADRDGFDAVDDCDDGDPRTYPGAEEQCDGVDNDCDGRTDGEDWRGNKLSCHDCIDAGYWRAAQDLFHSAPAWPEIRDTSRRFATCNYRSAIDFMFVDLDNHGGYVEALYTEAYTPVSNHRPNPGVMNTEHVWPKSRGASRPTVVCDLHHLYPADSQANNRRANYDFGEVVGHVEWERDGSRLGRDDRGKLVFEPRNIVKGDVARAMLYVSLQYRFDLSSREVALFQAWSMQDPPDQYEINRTWDIEARQGNANPFVVCPDLALFEPPYVRD